MKKLNKIISFPPLRLFILLIGIFTFRHSFDDLTLLSTYYPDSYLLFFCCVMFYIELFSIPINIVRKILEKRKEKQYNENNES